MPAIGVLGMGTFLPPTIRTNDWWPDAEVARWRDKMAHRATGVDALALDDLAPGARLTLAAMGALADDPFRGARARRVMAPDMTTTDMEVAAAQEAMIRAGVEAGDIDAIMVQTPVPEHLMVNQACVTHRRLGLPERCLVLSTEAACNGFAMHATVAQGLIASGAARRVLSVHSSAITRVHGPQEPHSAWWGDGAAAVIFGSVTTGRGLLAASHHADGRGCEALVLGVPGSAWWDDGAITTHAVDRTHTRAMLLGLVDRARASIHEVLEQAGLTPSDVDFYASHQGTAWLADVTRTHAGLDRADTIVTFPSLANMNSVNVPYVLAQAALEDRVRDGSVVVTFGGGLGETWSSLVFRWGC